MCFINFNNAVWKTQIDTCLLNQDVKNNFLRSKTPAEILLRSQGIDYEA